MTRVAWIPTLRRWLSWALLLGIVSVADAKPKGAGPDRDKSAEVKRRKDADRKRDEAKRRERERPIQECMDERDGDPDEDREACEDETP